jgi:hypothetical protein
VSRDHKKTFYLKFIIRRLFNELGNSFNLSLVESGPSSTTLDRFVLSDLDRVRELSFFRFLLLQIKSWLSLIWTMSGQLRSQLYGILGIFDT